MFPCPLHASKPMKNYKVYTYFKISRSNVGRLSHDEHNRFALFNPNDQQSSAENSVNTLEACEMTQYLKKNIHEDNGETYTQYYITNITLMWLLIH